MLAVTTGHGERLVLKIALPDSSTGAVGHRRQATALRLGDPASWVRLVAADGVDGALLLERLGDRLDSRGLAVEDVIDIAADTLAREWRPAPVGADLPSGLDQLDWLEGFVTSTAPAFADRCSDAVVREALACIGARRSALDSVDPVMVHGDGHAANVLAHPSGDGTYRLVDPEGFVSQPEHDLGVLLRGFNAELLVSGDSVATAVAWHHRMAERTSTDVEAIWQWSTIERVSSGLLLASLGLDDEAGPMLSAASVLARQWPREQAGQERAALRRQPFEGDADLAWMAPSASVDEYDGHVPDDVVGLTEARRAAQDQG